MPNKPSFRHQVVSRRERSDFPLNHEVPSLADNYLLNAIKAAAAVS